MFQPLNFTLKQSFINAKQATMQLYKLRTAKYELEACRNGR